MCYQRIQTPILIHTDDKILSVAPDLLNGGNHVHLLCVGQLVNDVSGTAEQTTLLYTIPGGNKTGSKGSSSTLTACVFDTAQAINKTANYEYGVLFN